MKCWLFCTKEVGEKDREGLTAMSVWRLLKLALAKAVAF